MIYFITCSVIWGLTWIAIKYQFHSVDSSVAVFYRFAVASLILFALAKIRKISLTYSRDNHLNFAAQGLFMFCMNYVLTYWAEEMAPSALVALAFTSLIFFNMFGGRLFLKLSIQQKVFTGAFISLIGMGFISYNELQAMHLTPGSLIGFIISLVATLSASAGNLFSMQSRQRKIPITANNAWGMLYGSLFTLAFCIIRQKSFGIVHFDAAFIISFVYLTLFGTVISFWAYLKLIESAGPSKAAFTSVVSPIIAVGVSMIYENLPLTLYLTLGIIFCLMGNAVALTPFEKFKFKKYAN